MVKLLERNAPLLIALLGAYWVMNNFIDKGRELTAPITKPVSKVLAEIQFFVNGSNYIKYPNAGFFLNPEKLDYTLKIADMQWLKAMAMAHDDHEDFLNEIFDNDLRLKNQYRPLLSGLVDSESIAAAAKV